MKLPLALENEDQVRGAWAVAEWLDSMADARGLTVPARIVCRASAKVVRRELLGREPMRLREHR